MSQGFTINDLPNKNDLQGNDKLEIESGGKSNSTTVSSISSYVQKDADIEGLKKEQAKLATKDELSAVKKAQDNFATKEEVAFKENNKGIFLSGDSLNLFYKPENNIRGFYAFVGSKNPFRKWIVNKDGESFIETADIINFPDADLTDLAPKVNQEGKEVVYAKDGKIEIPKDVITSDSLLNMDGFGYKKNTDIPTSFTNLITSYTYVRNQAIANNGQVVTNFSSGSYNPTFFPIEEETDYLFSGGGLGNAPSLLYYDKDKNFISGLVIDNSYEIKTPKNTAFFRYNASNQIISTRGEDTFYMYKAPTEEVSKDLQVLIGLENINTSMVAPIQVSNTSIIPTTIKLKNGYYNSNDAFMDDRSWWTNEELLEIEPNTNYVTNIAFGSPSFSFYDINKKYIFSLMNRQTSFTTPVHAKYYRFVVRSQNLQSVYLRKGNVDGLSYYIPNLIVPPSNVIDFEISNKEIVEVAKYSNDGDFNVGARAVLAYSKQDNIRGKFIKSVDVDIRVDKSSFNVVFYDDSSLNANSFSKEFTDLPIGKNTLIIDKLLPKNSYIGFWGSASCYAIKKGRANDLAGGCIGAITDNNTDITIGVNAIDLNSGGGGSNSTINYRALGDSITEAESSYNNVLAKIFGFNYQNYGKGRAECMGTADGNTLANQIEKIPKGYTGLISVMIGINDYMNSRKEVGDAQVAISKNMDESMLTANLSEAFRYNMQKLKEKAPYADIMVISILKSAVSLEPTLSKYRDAQKKICSYLSIPYLDIYDKCKIYLGNKTLFLPDEVHPNADGHKEVAKVLYPHFKNLVEYLKTTNI